jgi:hypothetical protein
MCTKISYARDMLPREKYCFWRYRWFFGNFLHYFLDPPMASSVLSFVLKLYGHSKYMAYMHSMNVSFVMSNLIVQQCLFLSLFLLTKILLTMSIFTELGVDIQSSLEVNLWQKWSSLILKNKLLSSWQRITSQNNGKLFFQLVAH